MHFRKLGRNQRKNIVQLCLRTNKFGKQRASKQNQFILKAIYVESIRSYYTNIGGASGKNKVRRTKDLALIKSK